jgi:predicted Ser/Thr protein kinase
MCDGLPPETVMEDPPEEKVFLEYIKNVIAYINCEKVDGQEPDERLMRGVENKMDIPEWCADDFRRNVMCKLATALSRMPSQFVVTIDQMDMVPEFKQALTEYANEH